MTGEEFLWVTGGTRTSPAGWCSYRALALSLGIYLLLTVLLAALVVKAVLPEEGSFPLLAASCCLSSFAGGHAAVSAARSWGAWPGAMVERRRLSAARWWLWRCCAGSRSPGRAAGACCCCAALAGDFWQACWAGAGGSGSAVRSAGAARPEKPLVNFTKNTDLSACRGDCGHSGRSPAAGQTAQMWGVDAIVTRSCRFSGRGGCISYADFYEVYIIYVYIIFWHN